MKIYTADRVIKTSVFVLIVSLIVIVGQNSAFAATIKFEKEYVYQASELDSKSSCRTIALTQVKRLLLEELGTYLEGETEVKNYQVTKDQITTISAGVVQTEILNEKWDGQAYYLKARITADPTEVAKTIASVKNNRALLNELDNSKLRISQLMKELEDLKKEAKIKKEDKTLGKLYENAVANLNKSSSQELETIGMGLGNAKQYDQSLIFLNKAIEINPNNSSAYYGRALTYYFLKEYTKSLKDCDKSIALAPENELAYMIRGHNDFFLGNNDDAVADYSKVIALNSQNVMAYYLRAMSYQRVGKIPKAIADFSKMMELDPTNSNAYEGRGDSYSIIGNNQKAAEDYKTAAKLGSSTSQEKLKKLGVKFDTLVSRHTRESGYPDEIIKFDKEPVAERFSDNGNGTISDKSTGLVWQQRDDGQKRTWAAANTYCAVLDLAGLHGWRLPTKDELESIVDKSRRSPTINLIYFPNTESSFYWSSTTSSTHTMLAWSVNFFYGGTDSYLKEKAGHVRCVRGSR